MIWFLIYFFPLILLIVLLKINSSFRIQKKRQTMIYFIEVYYISLFFTMLITKITDGYFFLWNGVPQYEVTLERFFTSFAIYQIWILVTRNLNVSADIDSFIALKSLINKLIISLEANDIVLANSIKSDFFDKLTDTDQVMFNEESLALLTALKDKSLEDNDTLIILKLEVTNLELAIESLSLTWNQSFLLNLFK